MLENILEGYKSFVIKAAIKLFLAGACVLLQIAYKAVLLAYANLGLFGHNFNCFCYQSWREERCVVFL